MWYDFLEHSTFGVFEDLGFCPTFVGLPPTHRIPFKSDQFTEKFSEGSEMHVNFYFKVDEVF